MGSSKVHGLLEQLDQSDSDKEKNKMTKLSLIFV